MQAGGAGEPVTEDDNANRPQFMPQALKQALTHASVFVFKNGAQWATDDQRNDYVVAFRKKMRKTSRNVLGADFALVEIPSRVFFSQMAPMVHEDLF